MDSCVLKYLTWFILFNYELLKEKVPVKFHMKYKETFIKMPVL